MLNYKVETRLSTSDFYTKYGTHYTYTQRFYTFYDNGTYLGSYYESTDYRENKLIGMHISFVGDNDIIREIGLRKANSKQLSKNIPMKFMVSKGNPEIYSYSYYQA